MSPINRRCRAARICLSVVILTGAACFTCPAYAEMADVIDELVVTGERPGPAMWKVSNGEHDLWILATLSSLPKKMVWKSREVEARMAGSQVLITPPQARPGIGVFRFLSLIPSLYRAQHSPDGRSLSQKLPHDLYMRWLALRVKYLDHDDEQVRPLVAAVDLYEHVLDQMGLTDDDDDIWSAVKRLAKAHKVPVARVDVKVPIDDPKGIINGLTAIPEESEIGCLQDTMTRIETGMTVIVHRANLWASGNIAALRETISATEERKCRHAFLAAPQMREQWIRFHDMMTNAWLHTVDDALTNNPSSVTVLDMDEMLEPDGLLEKLKAKGYRITEP